MFILYYWSFDLELKCIHCGQLLHASDDKSMEGNNV